MDQDQLNAVLHWFGNAASIGAIIGALTGILPALAALIAFIWYAIQIYESKTFQNWRKTRQERQIAKLESKLLLMRAKRTITSMQDD